MVIVGCFCVLRFFVGGSVTFLRHGRDLQKFTVWF